MKLIIRSKHLRVTPAIRRHIARRAGFGLNRFRTDVDQVRIDLSVLNVPCGQPDHLCIVTISLVPHGLVVGTGSAGTPTLAADRALDRAVRRITMNRKIHRGADLVPVSEAMPFEPMDEYERITE